MRRYPVGIQSFEQMIEGKFAYIDKTGIMYDMVQTYHNVFLSRPRRFGKTLLVSTLECYFTGRKELFKGLKIDSLEKDWKQYPVLHFDMSTATFSNGQQLLNELNLKLLQYEKIYGKGEGEIEVNQRLTGIIQRARQQTGMPVVVLIDEYDKPMLDVMNDEDTEKIKAIRDIMRNFYSPLKGCNSDLRFLFLTGITKFSQLSIFSELNNLTNISMVEKYSSICGVTEEELHTEYGEDIQELADKLNISKEECFYQLKAEYDGYHFCDGCPDIYNPFSLVTALTNAKIEAYWFASATPTFLIGQIKKFKVRPHEVDDIQAFSSAFDIPVQNMKSVIPLMYQSGYLTIKNYDKLTQIYTLGIPNKEVRQGLMETLLQEVVGDENLIPAQQLLSKMFLALQNDDINTVLEHLKTLLGTIPYTENIAKDYEGHYQAILYVVFSFLCRYVQVEVRTPKGRVDVVIESPKNIYLIEIKLDKSASEALEQIDLKNYSSRFALTGKPVVMVGVNFSRETANIEDWKIVE